MTGLHEFIIKLDRPLNETFKTESGLEFYGNDRFHVDRLSNRVAKVVSTPVFHETPIKAGYEVMIEPTIFHKQIYRAKEQDYTNLVDKEKGLWRVIPQMIILYRKDKSHQWEGYLQNVLVEPIIEKEKEIKSSLILPQAKIKFKRQMPTIV